MKNILDLDRVQQFMKTFSLKLPIIQAGMVWTSGGSLAGHSAKAGIMGVIGAGSMNLEVLDQQIRKAKDIAQGGTLAVNLPLLYSKVEEQMQVALKHGINIFITSAGNPKTYTQDLKKEGAKVIHVIAHPKHAMKAEEAGCDAVVAEGFEAGGHNGQDEITTFCLIPQVADLVDIPVIAAGGIADSRGISASIALGASAAQMGTRFLMTKESQAHQNLKDHYLQVSTPSSTRLLMKKYVPVRLFENKFSKEVMQKESKGADREELIQLLGKGRAKSGILDGNLDEGELEIGQIISLIKDCPSVEELVKGFALELKNGPH